MLEFVGSNKFRGSTTSNKDILKLLCGTITPSRYDKP